MARDVRHASHCSNSTLPPPIRTTPFRNVSHIAALVRGLCCSPLSGGQSFRTQIAGGLRIRGVKLSEIRNSSLLPAGPMKPMLISCPRTME